VAGSATTSSRQRVDVFPNVKRRRSQRGTPICGAVSRFSALAGHLVWFRRRRAWERPGISQGPLFPVCRATEPQAPIRPLRRVTRLSMGQNLGGEDGPMGHSGFTKNGLVTADPVAGTPGDPEPTSSREDAGRHPLEDGRARLAGGIGSSRRLGRQLRGRASFVALSRSHPPAKQPPHIHRLGRQGCPQGGRRKAGCPPPCKAHFPAHRTHQGRRDQGRLIYRQAVTIDKGQQRAHLPSTRRG